MSKWSTIETDFGHDRRDEGRTGVGDAYSSSTATILMLEVWFIGGALATLIFGGKK